MFTPQADAGFDFGQSGPKKIHLAKGRTLTYADGQTPRIGDGAQSTAPGDWGQWGAARYDARTAAMQAAFKASGLSSPIPGLTDTYASGTFSVCAPYGICWEPSQETWEALVPPPATEERATETTGAAQRERGGNYPDATGGCGDGGGILGWRARDRSGKNAATGGRRDAGCLFGGWVGRAVFVALGAAGPVHFGKYFV